MARSSWNSTVETDKDNGDDKDAALELLDQRSALVSTANNWEPTTSRLPPKALPLRTTTHVVRKLFWTGLLALIVIIGLGILLWLIRYFVPSSENLYVHSSISCDLTTSGGSAVQNAFIINLRGAKHLTFTEAKSIDVIWQLFVGAGGRLWLAWISYKVFMDGLTRLTEQSSISFDLYASLAFSTTSLWTTYSALRGLLFAKGWRVKVFLCWFAMSTIYVLGFPTLMSATAGYVSPSTAGWNMSDGTFLTPQSGDLKGCMTFLNGADFGYSDDTIAEGPPVSQFDPLIPGADITSMKGVVAKVPDIEKDYPLFSSLINASFVSFSTPPIFDATNSTTSLPYNATNSLSGNEFQTKNFTQIYYIEGRQKSIHGGYLQSDRFYCYKKQNIELDDRAECLPTTYFVWGFSSLMVRINLCLLIAWVFGMYFVWLDANIYSALCRSGRKLRGNFRAAADLSEAMREVLGHETCAYSDAELLNELRMEPGIQYYASDAPEGDVSHIGLSSRRRARVPYNSTKLYGKYEKDR